jgi:hypothetical protein
MNKFIELLAGLVLLIVPIYLWIDGERFNLGFIGPAASSFFWGGLVWLLILIGIIFILIGISDIKG